MLSTIISLNNITPTLNNDPIFSEPNSNHIYKSLNKETLLPHFNISTPKRKDAYGTLIIKGSKQHKVSFIDIVSLYHKEATNNSIQNEVPLVEIIDVCSFKAHNEKMSYKENDQFADNGDVSCCDDKCLIT